MMNKEKLLRGVLIIVGLYYLVIPHSVHVTYNLDFGLTHMTHNLIGIGLILGGLFIKKIKIS